jgi:hypothetical protein
MHWQGPVAIYANQTLEDTYDSVRVVRYKNIVMGPAGPGTKNDCAGEDQQVLPLSAVKGNKHPINSIINLDPVFSH